MPIGESIDRIDPVGLLIMRGLPGDEFLPTQAYHLEQCPACSGLRYKTEQKAARTDGE
jgi:hypothetical protein